jgi:hypothetical protein
MQLYFLANVELLSELDQYAINCVVVIRIVSTGSGKMQDDKVVLWARLNQLLMVLEPFD